MPTNYPGSVDTFTNPTATDEMDDVGVEHDEQHANVNDAIEAVETALLTNGKGYVNHGASAGTARPQGFASIEWHGTVEPTNAVNGDTWVDTS